MRLDVRVPATTANVGSGFDCVGIAIDWYDQLVLQVSGEGGLVVKVTGEGDGQVPTDETHLVISSLQRGLHEWGGGMPGGLRLEAHNTIPHSRGLGSSAAAIVAGLAFAWGITFPGRELDRAELTRMASELEGHPDNAGAAVWGGAVLAWMDAGEVSLLQLEVHPDLATAVWVPSFEVPTAGARSVLPDRVPRADAVAQATAAATLPIALALRPDLLMAATADRLHQDYRAHLMESSYQLMGELRQFGVAATISGAGPAIFAIGTPEQLEGALRVDAARLGFQHFGLPLGSGVGLTGIL